jgi:hypothetical protein
VLSVWSFSITLAVISAAVVILTAGYILWTIQRVYLGPEYKGPHAEALRPMSLREIAIAAPLVFLAVLLGVFPTALLNYTDATIGGLVKQLNPARVSAVADSSSPLPPGEGQGVRVAANRVRATSLGAPSPDSFAKNLQPVVRIDAPSPQPSPGGRGGSVAPSLANNPTP